MFCDNKTTSENRDYCVTPSFKITPDQGVQKPIIILCRVISLHLISLFHIFNMQIFLRDLKLRSST